MTYLTEQISSPLRRPIKSGNHYNSLLPKVSCDVASKFGDNKNTIEGVEFMAQMVKKYSHQVKRLAEKLQKSSLNENVLAIDDFLFHHFQYQADAALQQLRSPACSWYHRQKGIDCKSYSIFASCLLRELGINHFIRQIKQPGFYPDQFTHVYVIVPTNQNSAADVMDFNGDYLVIDPTDKTKQEPRFIDKKDKYMSGLSYVGLNASSSTSEEKEPIQHIIDNAIVFKKAGFSQEKYVELATYLQSLLNSGLRSNQIRIQFLQQGLQVSTQNENRLFIPNNVFNWRERFFAATRENGLNGDMSWLSDIDFNGLFSSFGDIFGGFSGGWYKKKGVEEDSETIVNYFSALITEANQALSNGNFNTVAKKTAEFKAMSILLVRVADCAERRCFESSTWSSSTRNGMKAIRRLCERIKNNGSSLINSWISQNFNIGTQNSSYTINANQFYQTKGIFKLLKAGGKTHGIDYTENVSVPTLTPKPNIEIKALSFDANLIENDVINVGSILNNLSNVLFSNTSGGNNTENTNTGGGSGNTSNWGEGLPNTTNQASIGGFSTKTIAIGTGITALGFLLWPTIKKQLNN